MGIMIKGVLALFWLVLIPMGAGIPMLGKKQDRGFGEYILSGYLVLFSITEIFTLAATWFHLPLHVLSTAYGITGVGLSLWGFFCLYKKKQPLSLRKRFADISIYMWLAVILILAQVVMCSVMAHMDADDCFYVATATTSVQTDSVFKVNAYTGGIYKKLPKRYILSPFPIFLAVVSQLSGGLHPAIMAHMVFPAVFVPISYLVQSFIGKKLLGENKDARGIYMLMVVLMTGFSAYSVFNTGSFQIVRIWQGKALFASMLLPLVFYLCFCLFMEKKPRYPWYFLAMADLSCCLLTSMGIVLTPVMIGCFLMVSLICNRNIKHLWKAVLCCLPSLLLGILYLGLFGM